MSKLLNFVDLPNLIGQSKQNKLSINILFFSTLLLPFSFVAGPAITEILVFLIFFTYIWCQYKRKEKISFNKFEILIFSFFSLLIISSLLSDHKLISLKSSFFSIRFIILTYAIIFLLQNFKFFLKYFFISCFVCVTITIADGFIQFFFGKDIFFNPIQGQSTITGFFGDEKKLGSFLCRFFPILVGSYFLISNEKIEKKIIKIIFYFVPFYIICFLTSERVSMFYSALTFCFIIIYLAKFNKKIFFIFPIIIFIIPAFLYTFNIFFFKNTVNSSYKQIFGFHGNQPQYFSKQHELFAKTSFKLFKKNIPFGIGPNNYRKKCDSIKFVFIPDDLMEFQYIYEDDFPTTNCSTHPHNIFFQLLAETGFFGIMYYLIFIMLVFYETFKFLFKKNYYQIKFFFLLPVIFYLNPILPSGNFFNNWYMVMGIIGLPFYLYLTKIKKSV